MNHALSLNVFIVVLTVVALVVTANPLCLFCLMFLVDLPYGLVKNPNNETSEERYIDAVSESQPMGFLR